MYAKGTRPPTVPKMGFDEKEWCHWDDAHQARSISKRFVDCICPKCTLVHQVYMLWTGRGIPRKYCSSCKSLISGYDDSAHYESAVLVPWHPREKGSQHEGE
jgi:hypothetical protein